MYECLNKVTLEPAICVFESLVPWAQVFVAVVAIVVAIFIPWKIHQNEHRRVAREEHAKGRSLTILLILPLTEILHRLALLQQSKAGIYPKDYEIPGLVLEQIQNFYLLGDGGVKIQHFIGLCDAASRSSDRSAIREATGLYHDNPVVVDMIETLNSALADLKKIRDTKD
jgi:hypothetical protein